MSVSSPPLLAVLIDAENTCAAHAEFVMTRALELGNATVRWAYGDWTTTQLMPWKKQMGLLGIRPRQQFRYIKGKNTSDSALIMDAMQLLYRERIDGFCIVSSDSDYAGLAVRIRESGLKVFGFGLRNTLPVFVAACDEFHYLDEEPATGD